MSPTVFLIAIFLEVARSIRRTSFRVNIILTGDDGTRHEIFMVDHRQKHSYGLLSNGRMRKARSGEVKEGTKIFPFVPDRCPLNPSSFRTSRSFQTDSHDSFRCV
jgi:hypothetical protein